ncbi:MAG: DUF465 domain-containing protein [Sphingopyxis sp.]
MRHSAGALHAHETALSARHADLEARLLNETLRPNPDMVAILEIKKAKLRIKDALHYR